MKKSFKALLKELENIKLPDGEYAIYGSGPMAVRGIRDTEDLDVIVTNGLFQKLEEKYGKDKKWVRVKIGNIEIYPFWNWEPEILGLDQMIKDAELIDGLRYVRLNDLVECKRKFNKPKHFEDIKLIKEYQKKKSRLTKTELAHSFNIVLSEEVKGQIKKVQKKLATKFKEQRFYDNSPHLAVCTKFMSSAKTENFVEALQKEFLDEKSFELCFADFSIAGNYIILNFDKETTGKIFELSKRAFMATSGIGSEGMNGDDKPRYSYYPHVSIQKLQQEELMEALSLLKEDFRGIKMPVQQFEITMETLDEEGFGSFPVIKTIKVKKG